MKRFQAQRNKETTSSALRIAEIMNAADPDVFGCVQRTQTFSLFPRAAAQSEHFIEKGAATGFH
jgi:hypothetical protein